MRLPLLLPVLAIAACSGPAPRTQVDANMTSAGAVEKTVATPTPVPSAAPTPATEAPDAATAAPVARSQAFYLGRWIGVEGMYLNVAAKPDGGVTLDMQWDLDNHGRFDGSVTAEGLRFMRGGVAETLVPSDGAATGLKWLADAKDCLTVKPGEGYCRDGRSR